jgi:hypothetical protein
MAGAFGVARYFFHVREGVSLIEDADGVELVQTSDIVCKLRRAAREVLAESEWDLSRAPDRSFEIADSLGKVVAIVPFGNSRSHP